MDRSERSRSAETRTPAFTRLQTWPLHGRRLNSRFQVRDGLQRVVPSGFQLSGDQPVLRIRRVVLPLSPSCLIASFLQRQLESLAFLVVLPSLLLSRFKCRFDPDRLNRFQHAHDHGVVEPRLPTFRQAPVPRWTRPPEQL